MPGQTGCQGAELEVLRLGQCRALQDALSGLTFHLSDSGLSAYVHRMGVGIFS